MEVKVQPGLVKDGNLYNCDPEDANVWVIMLGRRIIATSLDRIDADGIAASLNINIDRINNREWMLNKDGTVDAKPPRTRWGRYLNIFGFACIFGAVIIHTMQGNIQDATFYLLLAVMFILLLPERGDGENKNTPNKG